MHSVKQKVSDAAAEAKERVDVLKAKAGEKAEMSTARTKEGKQIAKERRKAKEAEANMMLHQAKAQHAAEALHGKQHGLFGHNHYGPAPVKHGHNYPTGATHVPTANAAAPGYGHYNTTGTTVPPANVAAPTHNTLGGHRHRHHNHHMGLN
ncbi:late embryogenesis abundant protein 18-like [Henckelia pumila]|uniref:late embryogenesis abundant protein 18-like n=1 Tax=Henckelia pumila TaxID=405737 RepID=UPI003C6DE270